MANLIELKPGMRVPAVRLALVVSSSSPPPEGSMIEDRGSNRTFFVGVSEHDIAVITQRAVAWADARQIPNVYLRREP